MSENVLIAEVEKILNYCKKDTKIILWGAALLGGYVQIILESLGRDFAYYIDSSEKLQKSGVRGKQVKSPYDLLYEDVSKICVIWTMTETPEVEEIARNLQLKKGINLFDLNGVGKYKRYNCLDPFLGYSRKDDLGAFRIFTNIDRYKNYEEILKKRDSLKKEIRILCLGGSTTDFSQSWVKSWPECLHERLIGMNIPHIVMNGGIGGYYSAQELWKLIRDGLYLFPDIVISYSGINDAVLSFKDKKHPFINSYLRDIMNVHIKGSVQSDNNDKKFQDIDYGFLTEESDAAFWMRCMRLMHGICAEYKILFYGFLQPSRFYGKHDISQTEYKMMELRYEDEALKKGYDFFEEASRYCSEFDYLYDLTQLFNGKTGIFYDMAHTSEKGNYLIAEAIYKKIKAHVLYS